MGVMRVVVFRIECGTSEDENLSRHSREGGGEQR